MTVENSASEPETNRDESDAESAPTESQTPATREIGGRKKGLDPTRYGDWEKNGRCIDF
jgi:shikimate dehydrogenase